MLAPHAVDIAVIISSLIASLCFTFPEPFDDIFQVVHWSAEIQTKVYDLRKEGSIDRPTDRPTDQASEFALAHLTPILHFCKVVVKMGVNELVDELKELKTKIKDVFSKSLW